MPMPSRQIVGGELYRYAFQGQEKDTETNKEAFQLRLWDGRIGRWLTTDPMGQYNSPYIGMGNDPINGIDPDGGWETKIGQLWGWARNGFKGERFTSEIGTGNYKYGIDTNSGIGSDLIYSQKDYNTSSLNWQYDSNGNGYYDGVIFEDKLTKAEILREFGVKKGIPFTKTIYNIADDIKVFTTSFDLLSPNNQPQHLDGSIAFRGSSEHLDDALNGLITVMPTPVYGLRGVNMGSFNKLVGGTSIARLAPKTKGYIVSMINKLYKTNVTPKKVIKQTKSNFEKIKP